jgi:hypothetical protein
MVLFITQEVLTMFKKCIFKYILISSIFLSCSQKIYIVDENEANIDIIEYDCIDGKMTFSIRIENCSDKEIILEKVFLEHAKHEIVDNNNNIPMLYKSIQVTTTKQILIIIEPKEIKDVTFEAKFLNSYSLIDGMEYELELNYFNPSVSKRKQKMGFVKNMKLGNIIITACE